MLPFNSSGSFYIAADPIAAALQIRDTLFTLPANITAAVKRLGLVFMNINRQSLRFTKADA